MVGPGRRDRIARAVVSALLAFSATPIVQADVFVLGSSFVNDALPQFLDDSPQWHIDCGKPLQYIFDNPSLPCLDTSTLWTDALTAMQFDQIAFQPVTAWGEETTQQSDIDVISYWISLQPEALVVIHPTWPRLGIWEESFHTPGGNQEHGAGPNADHTITNYSQEYYYELIDNLRIANPGRRFVTDRSNEMLDSIYHDIENGIGPFTDFDQLFRDQSGHSSFDYGSYLQHNALRQAFGQQTGLDNSPYGVGPVEQAYLDEKVLAFPPLPSDVDRDSVYDVDDNCPTIFNPDQPDADADGVGNDCDNCPFHVNSAQGDLDGDAEGDRCDSDDGSIFMFFDDPLHVEWDEEAGVDGWDCYRGDLGKLRATGVYIQRLDTKPQALKSCGMSEPFMQDPVVPARSKVNFYLTTSMTDGPASHLGTDSSGSPRPNADPCP